MLKLCDGADDAIAKINENRRLSGAQRTTRLRQVENILQRCVLQLRARFAVNSPSFENGTEHEEDLPNYFGKHRSEKWLQISNARGPPHCRHTPHPKKQP